MPNEDRDLTIKRFEKLYELAVRTYDRQMQRFDHVEAKAWRHFAVLAFILGTLTVGIPTFVKALRAADGLWAVAFGLSYLGMIAASLVAVGFLVRALRYHKVKAEPFTPDVISDFFERRYLNELVSLSKGLAEARSWNGDVLDEKVGAAKWGYRSTVVALGLGGATIVLLLCIEWQTTNAILP